MNEISCEFFALIKEPLLGKHSILWDAQSSLYVWYTYVCVILYVQVESLREGVRGVEGVEEHVGDRRKSSSTKRH